MISGLARQRRLANRAGQRPSDWGAIPRRLPKTLSRCRGSLLRLLIFTERSRQRSTQHVAVLQQIKVCWRGPVKENVCLSRPAGFFSHRSHRFSSSQQLFGGNVRWLHLPLPVGEPARMSALHQKQLQGDCQRVHPGNTGRDAESGNRSGTEAHTHWGNLKFNWKWSKILQQCCNQKMEDTLLKIMFFNLLRATAHLLPWKNIHCT